MLNGDGAIPSDGSFPDSNKYWVIVASKDHVMRGVEGGFCQAGHGKEGPLHRMKRGDWVVFYSPKESLEGQTPCRKFTALGELKDERVYQVEQSPDFRPFRRDVRFIAVEETPIEPLLPKLAFIKNKKAWGSVFRFGLIQIPREDFLVIAHKLLAK